MSSISYNEDFKRVLITGFTPFKEVNPNPSWQGVLSMNQKEIENNCNICLFREEINVRYDDVDLSVPKLWDKLQPDLTIHVGVGDKECFVLETQAHKCGYTTADLDNRCPENNENRCDGPECITTQLNVEAISKEFNEPPPEGLKAEISDEAGLYLCEYTYYTSLSRDSSKTLFVHVPRFKYSFEQIAKGLERILEICLSQTFGIKFRREAVLVQ